MTYCQLVSNENGHPYVDAVILLMSLTTIIITTVIAMQ